MLTLDNVELNTISKSIEEGIVTFDSQGCITFFSTAAEATTGWLAEDAIGASINQIFRLPEGKVQFMDLLPSPGESSQVKVLHRDNTSLTLIVNVLKTDALLQSNGKCMLVIKDITDQEAVNHLQSFFIASITHEFRTPLSAINASVEFLLNEMDLLSRKEVKDLLRSLHLSVTGLQTLIENLLESINIEAGSFYIRHEHFDLQNAIHESVRIMKPLLDRRQQTLVIHKPQNLPDVKGDCTRITQALVNLLSNASKFGPMEGRIDLTLERDGEHYIRVSIADRGPGLPPSEKAFLFQRFTRKSDNDGTVYGLRLGLSVVKAIVDQHGGEVGADNRPGGGSSFWFTIPIEGKR